MAPDPSPHAIGMERGCVEDQPKRVGSSKASGVCSVLRLVEDDTAALRSNSAGRDQGACFFHTLRNPLHRLRSSAAIGNWQLAIGNFAILPHRRNAKLPNAA